jgi:microsomal dipeptidase-like Zn-dependent dipeptidase
LVEHGFGDADIAKVLRENWLRVLSSVEPPIASAVR